MYPPKKYVSICIFVYLYSQWGTSLFLLSQFQSGREVLLLGLNVFDIGHPIKVNIMF